MNKDTKISQLQIRVTQEEKQAIQLAAKKVNMGMSEFVLDKVFSQDQSRFQKLMKQLKASKEKTYILAEIHDLFMKVTTSEFEQMIRMPPIVRLSPYWENYIAAMIEHTAHQKEVTTPAWLHEIEPLDHPHFGSDLKSLRLYLLTHSPSSFRNRNIFIDASVGERV